ncbi:unnamed protein product, partial [Phaeothamnion confervicola]
ADGCRSPHNRGGGNSRRRRRRNGGGHCADAICSPGGQLSRFGSGCSGGRGGSNYGQHAKSVVFAINTTAPSAAPWAMPPPALPASDGGFNGHQPGEISGGGGGGGRAFPYYQQEELAMSA